MAASNLKRLAVVAHFDPRGNVSEQTCSLLDDLSKVFSDIIIVSTSVRPEEKAQLEKYGQVLIRPNLGYDFASWRAGIEHARRTVDFSTLSEIAIVNDSFYLLRPSVFASAFARMQNIAADIWSLTASHQIGYHLQSFCIVFRQKAFCSRWFDRFWSSVWEYGDRAFVIAQYELAMTAEAQRAGFLVDSVFDTKKLKEVSSADKDVNPMHILWMLVARDIGIVKAELLRTNPHNLDISALPQLTTGKRLATITRHVADRKSDVEFPGITYQEEAALFAKQSRACVAVHVHLHYPELLDELMLATRQIILPCDVFVTCTNRSLLPAIVSRVKLQHRDARIIPVENAGRDIGPFLALMNAGVFAPYAVVCKIHSKKSNYSEHGDDWRGQLVGSLLGSSRDTLDIIEAFTRRPKLGIVAPARSFVRAAKHWGANRKRVVELARRMNPLYDDENTPLAFAAGSMFWFRPQALLPLVTLEIGADDFEPEAGAQDGTLAHAVERLTSISAWSAGFEVTDSDHLSTCLTAIGEDDSYIPVL